MLWPDGELIWPNQAVLWPAHVADWPQRVVRARTGIELVFSAPGGSAARVEQTVGATGLDQFPTERIDVALDLHCHTSHSMDGHVDPLRAAQLALERGLTHLAITDHDTIAGALEARAAAPAGLTVIVGQEVTTRAGDLIGLFLNEPIPPGLSVSAAVAEIREQGGVVGLPHPFDSWRRSIAARMAQPDELARLAGMVDYLEAFNGRIHDPQHDALAADFARQHGLPVVAVSDAHEASHVAGAYTVLTGTVTDAASFLSALRGGQRRHYVTPAAMRGEPELEPDGRLAERVRRLTPPSPRLALARLPIARRRG